MKLVNFIKKINKIDVKINEFELCIFIFMCCGILGFFIEELYDTLYNLKLDKNGFLYGLFLPIYGWGALAIHFINKNTKKNPLITFLLIVIFASIFEYLTGAIIFKIWNKRLWDYQGYFMNINGYICIFSVISFGILGLLYIYFIEPLIKVIINNLNKKKLDFILKVFLILYLFDNIFSFLVKNKL